MTRVGSRREIGGTPMGHASLSRWLAALTFSAMALGCASTAGGNVADATPDVSAVDLVVDALEDRPAPDVTAVDATADVTVVEASVDAAPLDVTPSPPPVVVRADTICGVAAAIDGSSSVVLYAAREGGRSEVRVEIVSRGVPGPPPPRLVLARYENSAACVGRHSLSSDGHGGFRAAWWNGADAVELAAFDSMGSITARGTTPTETPAPAQLIDNALALEGFSGELVAWVDRSGAGAQLHAATFEHAEGTASAPATLRVSASASAALPANVSSAALSFDRVSYTLTGVDGEAYLRAFALAGSTLTLRATLTVSGLGASPQVLWLSRQRPSSEEADITFVSGTRNITVSLVSGLDYFFATPVRARTLAIDTAWNRTDALPVNILLAPLGGPGVLWGSHRGGGYNRSVLLGTLGTAPFESCLVTQSPDEDSEWRQFAFQQVGLSDKVLAMIRRVSTGATSREELWIHHRAEHLGLCGL